MTNQIQHDQRLVEQLQELQQLKEKDLEFAQRVFEIVEDSENLFDNHKGQGKMKK